MKIVRVDAHLLSFPFAEPIELDYHGGHRQILKRDAMLIRVECAGGLVGYAPSSATEAVRDRIELSSAGHFSGDLNETTSSHFETAKFHFETSPPR